MNLKSLALVAGLLGFSVAATAQSKYIKDANKKYASENYCEAISRCELAYSKISRKGSGALKVKGDMAFKTAESYRHIENFKEAHDWYEKAILLKYYETDPMVYYYNGEMLRQMAEFKLAKEQFQKYATLVPSDEKAAIALRSCDEYDNYKEARTRHTITNVTQVNKEGFEMAPAFADKKQKQLAFSSSRGESTGSDDDPRTCEKYMDIFVAELDKNGNVSNIIPIDGDSINTEDNEGTLCIDGRGKTMFFTRCPNVKKNNLGCDIYISEMGSKKWEAPKKMNLKSNDTISVGHPCVTDDGKFLIFASDMPGGLGGRDLWYTTYDKKSDSWTSPVNMGSGINTAGDELFPTFGLNNELIYASNGLPGMGGLDMYHADRIGEENKWENPTNYGSPINCEFNDYAMLQVTDRKGYFTSERKGGAGEDQFRPDIWMYELPPNLFSLKVNVFDLSDKTRQTKIDGAKVIVTGPNKVKFEGVTNKDGSIFWDKNGKGERFINEESTYKIMISKKGFYEDTLGQKITTIGLKENQDFVVDMGLFPIKPIRLPEVRYALGKWDLLVDSSINSKDSLLFVYNLLEEYPGLILELSSHTDPRGNNEFNRVLSDNRAKACYEYLVKEKGVDPRRIVPVGKGEMEPRTIFLHNGVYTERQQKDENGNLLGQSVVLTEAYINQFKADKRKYEMLMQYNRRTEGKIITLTDFDPAKTPAALPEYTIFRDLKTGKPLPTKK